MKNLIKIFAFVYLTFGIVSCDNDSVNNDEPTSGEPNNSEVLTSITINSTWVDYVETINLNNGKITDVQYNDGLYHLYTYSGDKVSQINEYDANDNILYSKSYSYDGNGRLIYRINTPNPDLTPFDYYVSHEYTYDTDLITVEYKIFDFDDVQSGDTQVRHLELNQNNIVKSYYPAFLANGSRDEATYSNNSPLTFNSYFSGDLLVVSNFEYVNEIASDAYSIGRYKFGDEWRINTLLSKDSSTLGTENLDDVSLNYLSSLNYSYNNESQSVSYVTNFSYEFNDDNLLLSQTQTKNSSDNPQPYVTIITYEYE
nr:hypothetical protein [uncultured Psychroserpens sp.]